MLYYPKRSGCHTEMYSDFIDVCPYSAGKDVCICPILSFHLLGNIFLEHLNNAFKQKQMVELTFVYKVDQLLFLFSLRDIFYKT